MLEAYAFTDPGCVRKNNEDYYYIDPDLGLYLLADGMGGAEGGELASRIAVETVVEYVQNCSERTVDSLAQAFEEANHRVLETAQQHPELQGMGTTLVGVMECEGQLVIASVGDSRAYLYEDGNLSVITEDHTWAHEIGSRLGLDAQRLKTHPMRHVLTMAVGVQSPLRINSYAVTPAPGVEFLLCSDGLHGVVSLETISEGLRSEQSLAAQCHYLVEQARQAGGPDNITAVLLRLNP
jgi:PPM family protein phosphatase